MSQPPPNIRRHSSRTYDIHNPSDLNELARKLSRRRSHRSTGGSVYTPSTPAAEQGHHWFPDTGEQGDGPYVAEPEQYRRDAAAAVALATPLGVPRLKSYGQGAGEGYGAGEELGPTASRRSRASQRPREDSVEEDEEEASSSDDDEDSKLILRTP